MNCKDCLHRDGCCNFVPIEGTIEEKAEYLYECLKRPCKDFKNKADFVEVVRCRDCIHGRKIDNAMSPEKYFKEDCVVCECKDTIGDEPMIYPPTHYCSYGERRKDNG